MSAAMQDHTRSSDLLLEAAARFILKTKETHRLTQTVMNSIIEDVTTFSQVMLGDSVPRDQFSQNQLPRDQFSRNQFSQNQLLMRSIPI